MVNVTILDKVILFEVAGWDKLWSFTSSLKIPADHITDVYAKSDVRMGWFNGLKLIGTNLPNILKAGTFYQDGEFVFWDVHDVQKAVVIELVHEHFGKLVIEVAEPDVVVAAIKQVIYSRLA